MWGAGAHRSSSRPFALTAAAAAAIFFGLLLAVLAPSWRMVLRRAGWHGLDEGSGLIQTIGVATEEEVKAVRVKPHMCRSRNSSSLFDGETMNGDAHID